MPSRTAALGALVVSLDSMINVAFPAIGHAFGRPPESLRWVVVSYVLTYAVVSFAAGVAGDRLGHLAVFRAGLVVNAAGLLLGALASSWSVHLAGRVLQGIGGGFVYGTAPALATAGVAPGARGRALGVLGAAVSVGLAAGPVVGGVLLGAWGWRSVYAVRAPLALALWPLARGAGLDPQLGGLAGPQLGGLAGPQLGDLAGRGAAPSWRGRRPGAGLADAVVGGVAAVAANGAIFAIWLLAPFYLVERRGLGAAVAGCVFALAPLGSVAGSWLGGRLVDGLGHRAPLVLGVLLEAVGLGGLALAGPGAPLASVGAGLALAGLGLGVSQVPCMALVMGVFPEGRQGAGGGLAFMLRTLGIVVGVLGVAEVFAATRAAHGFDQGYARAFAAAAGAVGLTALVPWLVRARRGAPR